MQEKRVAIVTGGSRGLGLETARQLAQAGFVVILVARDEVRLGLVANQMWSEGLPVQIWTADLTAPAAAAELAAFVTERYGRADILINNAAVFVEPKDFGNPAAGSILAVDPELVRTTLEHNVIAPLRLIQAFVPLMRRNGFGRIVNVASDMGQLAEMGGFWPGYRSSKTALNALTRVLASELEIAGDADLKVNSVCPGWCRTDMGGADAERSAQQGAASIVWAALLPADGPSGGFFRDGLPLDW